MRKGVFGFGRIFAAFLMLIASPLVFAQETVDYSWGTVVEISQDKLVLQEYNYETEDDVIVSYSFSKDVIIENAASLEDVKPGEEVEVGFFLQGQERIVTTLYVERDVYFEEEG